MGLGIWMLVDDKILKVIDLMGEAYQSDLFRVSAILLLSTGCALLLVAILGAVGAILESQVIMGVYIFLLIVMFCAEIVGAVLAIAFKDWMLDRLEERLYESLHETDPTYYITKDLKCAASENGALWDYVQNKMDCCGIHDAPYTGYETLTYSLSNTDNCTQFTNRNLPLTCCSEIDDAPDFKYDDQVSQINKYNCTTFKTEGCYDKVYDWVGDYAPVLIGIGFGVAFFQVLGFIFAVCVCVNARRHICCGQYKRQS
jgi:hypothetical protein